MRYQDIQIPDIALREQFYAYIRQGQYTDAVLLLMDNEQQLRGKAYVANTINIMINNVMYLENYYIDNVPMFLSNLAAQYQNLINELRKREQWINTAQYTPYNFVVYNDLIYMCLVQPPVGTVPTDTNYWILLNLKGEDGAGGIDNVTMKFNWDNNTVYQLNDLVVYNGTIYVALNQSQGKEPDTNPDNWAVFLSLVAEPIVVSITEPDVTINNVVWFQPDTDPLQGTIDTPINGQFKKYIKADDIWVDMYPNTLFKLVSLPPDTKKELFIDDITIGPNQWVNLEYTYTYAGLTDEDLVQVLPNGVYSSEQTKAYNNLSIAINGINIVLTSTQAVSVSLPIRILIQ